jgi:murein DD-endopeptidase MepM/ murein hydrolase activator NlpD
VTIRIRPLLVLGVVACLAASLGLPARADTAGELQAARDRLDAARADLNQAAAAWNDAETRLARSQDAIAGTKAEIDRLERDLRDIRARLDARAVATFMAGGNLELGSLLSSESLADLADRLQFTRSIAQGDRDLATAVEARTVELERQRQRLAEALQDRTRAVADIDAQRLAIAAKVRAYEDVVADLQAKLDRQEQAALSIPGAAPVVGSGAIATCPVHGPNSFIDTFGWPRPGGRTHQGIDLIAPFGTPVVATHSGTVRRTSSSLGGFGASVFHDGSADWTFYTHFSSYGASGHVSAGTVIGYVGSTGDTNVNHLHFEYHPGGGAAVDPYGLLRAVC